MKTAQLTVKLPKTEITFLERYAQRHQVSIAELFDTYIKQLHQTEEAEQEVVSQLTDSQQQDPVEDFLAKWTGILKGTDPDELKFQYLQEKYT